MTGQMQFLTIANAVMSVSRIQIVGYFLGSTSE